MENSSFQYSTFNAGDMDLSFVHDMVAGGISDDGSSLIGDVSFDDNKDYSNISATTDELNEFARKHGLNFSF